MFDLCCWFFKCQKGGKSKWKVEHSTFHFYKLPKKQRPVLAKNEKVIPPAGKRGCYWALKFERKEQLYFWNFYRNHARRGHWPKGYNVFHISLGTTPSWIKVKSSIWEKSNKFCECKMKTKYNSVQRHQWWLWGRGALRKTSVIESLLK